MRDSGLTSFGELGLYFGQFASARIFAGVRILNDDGAGDGMRFRNSAASSRSAMY